MRDTSEMKRSQYAGGSPDARHAASMEMMVKAPCNPAFPCTTYPTPHSPCNVLCAIYPCTMNAVLCAIPCTIYPRAIYPVPHTQHHYTTCRLNHFGTTTLLHTCCMPHLIMQLSLLSLRWTQTLPLPHTRVSLGRMHAPHVSRWAGCRGHLRGDAGGSHRTHGPPEQHKASGELWRLLQTERTG